MGDILSSRPRLRIWIEGGRLRAVHRLLRKPWPGGGSAMDRDANPAGATRGQGELDSLHARTGDAGLRGGAPALFSRRSAQSAGSDRTAAERRRHRAVDPDPFRPAAIGPCARVHGLCRGRIGQASANDRRRRKRRTSDGCAVPDDARGLQVTGANGPGARACDEPGRNLAICTSTCAAPLSTSRRLRISVTAVGDTLPRARSPHCSSPRGSEDAGPPLRRADGGGPRRFFRSDVLSSATPVRSPPRSRHFVKPRTYYEHSKTGRKDPDNLPSLQLHIAADLSTGCGRVYAKDVLKHASRTRRRNGSDLRGDSQMKDITRRGLIVAGSALATGAFFRRRKRRPA